MGVFRVPIEIGAPSGSEFETVDAVVDTGATYTTLPGSVLTRLESRHTAGALADGRRREFDMARAAVRMDGDVVSTIVIFGDESITPLLGAYTLEGLGLSVDPNGQRLVELDGRL